nr:MAG TPA: hypothetical protein [Caudoviricetes sp.]
MHKRIRYSTMNIVTEQQTTKTATRKNREKRGNYDE